MKSAFQFATFAMLCIFPVLIVIGAAFGGDARRLIATRLGLNPQAAKDVDALIGSGHQALATLNVLSIAFLVLCAIAIASTLREWYQKGLRPAAVPRLAAAARQPRGLGGRPAGLHLGCRQWSDGRSAPRAVTCSSTPPSSGSPLSSTLGMLLLGKVSWRALFPAGLATAACFTGLSVFSSLFFSSSLISDDKSYGPVGVVMVLLEYFIAIAVVVHLGAVIGRMWNERHASPEERADRPAAQPGA
jgi:membrane protein